MSSQRGNVKQKGQKYQNSVAFDALRYEKNPKKKQIATTQVVQVSFIFQLT